jgi:hypothetical protein
VKPDSRYTAPATPSGRNISASSARRRAGSSRR